MDTATAPHAFATSADWHMWLATHHAHSHGIWLLIGKKGVAQSLITISEALDVALCYGWIDSQRKGNDTQTYLQRYSPRRAKSPWSRLNVERVTVLTEAGRMKAGGLAEVAAAQADGRWPMIRKTRPGYRRIWRRPLPKTKLPQQPSRTSTRPANTR